MKNKIKVLHLLPSGNFGGAERNLLNLIPYLNKYGCDNYVCFGKGGVLTEDFKKAGAKVNIISSDILNYRNVSNLCKAIYRLILFIKKEKIDLIHSHLVVPHFVSILIKKMTNIPVIIHVHGYEFFDRKEFFDLKVPKFLPVHSFNMMMSKILFPFSDKIIVITKGSYQALKKRKFLSEKVIYIPNGISISSFDIQKRYNNKKFTFVSLGRLVEQKNYSFLLEVIKDIPENFDFRIYIAGDGPLYSYLNELINRYNLIEKVFLLGYVKNVREVLLDAHCFILPSICEFFPISVLEAMSMSLPIITSNVGGMEDLVEDGVNGFLCPVNNKEKFLESMIYFLKNKEKSFQMGQNSFKKVKESFLIEKISDKIFNVYVEVLGKFKK